MVEESRADGPIGPPVPTRRRAPYPVSPNIGPEGSRAAQEIIDTARRMFAERGYHGTSITAICAATGRSEPAFYQYFPSKHELFKLFFEEIGKELVAHFEQLQTISADQAGLARLRTWLRGLGEVLHRYPTVYMEWPIPDADEPAAENPQERYLVRLADALSARLGAADAGDVGDRVLSIAVICLVAWSHVVLDTRTAVTGRADARVPVLDEVLTRIVHRAFFPPAPVSGGTAPLDAGRGDAPRPSEPAPPDRPDAVPPAGIRKAPTRPAAHRTIERITAAAAVAFDRTGLSGTSVNDIVAEAGVARGTFYLYWTDRAAILATLMHQAAEAVRDRFDALRRVRTGAELTVWLNRWLDVIDRHGVTLHIWTAEVVEHPGLQPLDREMRSCLERTTRELLGGAGHLSGLQPRAGAIALWTVLTEFPYAAWRHRPVLSRDDVVRAQRFLLTRGFAAWE